MARELMKSIQFTLAGTVLATALPAAKADSLRYLPEARVALAQIYLDIKSAKKSIDMTYFMFETCSTTGKIVTKLLKDRFRENRSFRSRLVVDASYFPEAERNAFATEMAKYGMEIRAYNRAQKPNPAANFRHHVKFLIVDNEKYISGGRNIADDYYSLNEEFGFIDRDVRVTGSSVPEAVAAYQKLWTARSTFPVSRASREAVEKQREECWGLTKHDREVIAFLEKNAEEIVSKSPEIACTDTRFVMDEPAFPELPGDGGDIYLSGERYQSKHTTAAIVDMLMNAKRSMLMENQYVVISDLISEAFERARTKKIPVKVITSLVPDDPLIIPLHLISMKKENRGSVHTLSVSAIGAVTDRWEMSPKIPKWLIHGKTFVVDGKDAIVSSYNLDPRSYHTNLESAVVVKSCPKFAAAVAQPMHKLEDVIKKDLSCDDCWETPEISPKDSWTSRLLEIFL